MWFRGEMLLESRSPRLLEPDCTQALTEHSVHGGLEQPHLGDSAFEVQELQIWGFEAAAEGKEADSKG